MNGKPETKHEGGYALDLCDAGRGAEEGAACGPLRPRSGGARAEKAYGGEGGTRAGTPGPLAQGREAPGLTLAQKEPRCAQAGGATPRAATGGACADAEGALPPGAAAGPRHGAARPEGRIGMAPQTKRAPRAAERRRRKRDRDGGPSAPGRGCAGVRTIGGLACAHT